MAVNDCARFFVITGGPGSGKSTLIDALEQRGYARSLEAGRAVIQEQAARGGSALPWFDPQAFAELMLKHEMQSYRSAGESEGPVFFDRGIPDVAGYLRLMKLPVAEHVDKAARVLRYNRRAFIAPPWPRIYEQDAERKQSLEEAEQTYRAMVETYSFYGYDLIALPRAPVAERVRFVLDQIAAGERHAAERL